MALAKRHGTPLCLVYLDLDRFKAVNDKFGHARGDEALKRVAMLIEASVRETDIVGRLGGDEFAVILSHSGVEDAKAKAETLARRIEKISIRPSDRKDGEGAITLGASCGVALWNGVAGADRLLAEADEAMFRAKAQRAGKRDKNSSI